MLALLRRSLLGLFVAGLLLALPGQSQAQWTSRYVYPGGYTTYFYGGGGYGYPGYSGFSNPGVYGYNSPGAYSYRNGRVFGYSIERRSAPIRGYLVPPRSGTQYYGTR